MKILPKWILFKYLKVFYIQFFFLFKYKNSSFHLNDGIMSAANFRTITDNSSDR
jgi:hypothetical protein